MGDGLGFLTAVYRDGRVHIGGQKLPGRNLCGAAFESVL